MKVHARESIGENGERFRAAFEQAAVGMTQVALDGKLLMVNQRVCEITGYSRDELLATNFQQITHPDDLQRDVAALGQFISGKIQTYSVEKRYIHKDGHVVWVKLSTSIARDGATCEPLYFISVLDDITEYKKAHTARLKAEEKCSKAFRVAPMAITLTSTKDHRYLEVNEAFERLTGWRREEVIGRTPFDIGIWVDPSERLEFLRRTLAGDSVINQEYRFRIKDGSIRIGLGSAELIDIDGELCMLSGALDITDRKRIEEELQVLSIRLINAHEEERRRISKELSDVIGQSVSLLAIQLTQLARRTRGERRQALERLCLKAQDIASDVSSISQGLHPSLLEYVGLPRAIEQLCRELTKVYGVQVGFKHEGVPESLSPEASLCLYRIAQDGLRNVVMHSGRQQAWLELIGSPEFIRLTLRDDGVGFDVASVKNGLGLARMRERCRLLGGEFAIQSQPGGTRIEAHVPLPRREARKSCAD